MFVFSIGVLVGAFIGWNFSQPQWAKDVQTKVITLWDNVVK